MKFVREPARDAAVAAGLTKYFTGRPCRRGHIAERNVSRHTCVVCRRDDSREQGRTSRAKENQTRHRKTPKAKATKRVWRARNRQTIREQVREQQRKRLGLPAPARPSPHTCENCGRLPNGNGCLHLDHDHTTGKFRGWLCHSCNLGLGLLGDDEAGALRILDYLARAL